VVFSRDTPHHKPLIMSLTLKNVSSVVVQTIPGVKVISQPYDYTHVITHLQGRGMLTGLTHVKDYSKCHNYKSLHEWLIREHFFITPWTNPKTISDMLPMLPHCSSGEAPIHLLILQDFDSVLFSHPDARGFIKTLAQECCFNSKFTVLTNVDTKTQADIMVQWNGGTKIVHIPY
jgi:hypothetical protein